MGVDELAQGHESRKTDPSPCCLVQGELAKAVLGAHPRDNAEGKLEG